MSKLMNEPLLAPDDNRFVMFPIKYDDIWRMYQKQVDCFWRPEEIDLSKDISHWNGLNEDEKYFISMILAFFAASDGIVLENLVLNFYNEIQIPEARNFYSVQMMIEAIHNQQYSLLIDTYVSNKKEKERLFKAIETIPCGEKKAKWALKWIEEGTTVVDTLPDFVKKGIMLLNEKTDLNDDMKNALHYFTKERPNIGQRLIAFICVEGIFFAGSFCAIYWLKNRGLMPGLSTANEFISRDEGMHRDFAILLYNILKNRDDYDINCNDDKIKMIVKEAVEIEKEFITSSFNCNLIGMNAVEMKNYIEFVADNLLENLEISKVYNTSNPFDFMENIGLRNKTNFFENRVTEYSKANSTASIENSQIILDDDF